MPRRTRLDFPTIDCLLAFESAARHGSFSRAAEELDTTQPVVSRHVARLEARASTRLFDRSRAGTFPTPAGERARAGISAGLDAIREGILGARAVAGEGRVVIACPPDVWQLPVLPLLDALRDALGRRRLVERHLEAGVMVAPGDGFVDLGGGPDAAIAAKGRAKPLAHEALAFFRAAIGGGPIAEGGGRPAGGERI